MSIIKGQHRLGEYYQDRIRRQLRSRGKTPDIQVPFLPAHTGSGQGLAIDCPASGIIRNAGAQQQDLYLVWRRRLYHIQLHQLERIVYSHVIGHHRWQTARCRPGQRLLNWIGRHGDLGLQSETLRQGSLGVAGFVDCLARTAGCLRCNINHLCDQRPGMSAGSGIGGARARGPVSITQRRGRSRTRTVFGESHHRQQAQQEEKDQDQAGKILPIHSHTPENKKEPPASKSAKRTSRKQGDSCLAWNQGETLLGMLPRPVPVARTQGDYESATTGTRRRRARKRRWAQPSLTLCRPI